MRVQLGFALIVLATTVPSLGQTVTPRPNSLIFSDAQVGISQGAAEALTATFQITGYSSLITPTATLQYGLAYKVGAVTCTGTTGSQSCSVSVTFAPNYPGGRQDALVLSNGSTTLGTIFAYGVGQSALALVQPGVISNPIASNANNLYQSAVGEDGTVYIVGENSNTVLSLTKAGVVTTLPITVTSPTSIAVDGAGTLYISQNTYSSQLITYSAAGVQGTLTVLPPPPYVPCSTFEYLYTVATGNAGDLFVNERLCNQIFELQGDGSYVTTAINPAIIKPSTLAVDSDEDLFIGGYTINELTSDGKQTQINTDGAGDGLAVDAAGTLYATRYTGTGGVAELPASGYDAPGATIDTAASPLGASVGPDGTVYVGNYTNLDKVDRSQGAVAFGEQFSGIAATPQTISLYNGGNDNLTISSMATSGSSTFSIAALPSNNCTSSSELVPGALCQVQIAFISAHPGNFTGRLTFTTNSLNAENSTQTVALSAYINGAYLTASPATLNFGSRTEGTTSATQNITLTNQGYGYGAAAHSPVSTDSGFSVGLGTCSANVAVGASCELNITFSPATVQSYSGTGTVQVLNVGPGSAPPVSFTLSGSGTAAVGSGTAAAAGGTVSPTINFGHQTE
jgi:hypothetical protein